MQKKRKNRSARYFWLGFAVTAAFMFAGFIAIGVWPFGDGTVLIIDSLHQYLPFYTDFHEKLVHRSSLLYSFSAGLGYNFWATYAYYLASPTNFLIALVPKANVCDFMDYSILVKVALCGGIFTWYLYRRRRRSGLFPVAFGTMYALSFYMIGYYFNLMWLDSIAMLPLIMKGIEQICGIGDDGRMDDSSDGRLYGLALFYGLWCNYYIGFMLCLFSVLYYIVCLVVRGRTEKRLFFARLGRFAWYSVLAGGMGSMVLFPAYKSLTASESMQTNHFPTVVKFYTNFIDMVMAQFADVTPVNISDTQVGLNTYCGVSVLLLVILYILDEKIRLRERLAKAALAGFLFLSFSMNMLNYIWHGFHQQNGLPNRFAFLYIAVILVMSFDALQDAGELDLWKILFSGIVPIAYAVCAFVLKLGADHEGNAYESSTYLITIALLAGYLALLVFIRVRHIRKMLAGLFVSTMCIAEAGVSAVYGIVCNDSVTRSIYLNDQASYGTLMSEIGDDSWYRSEVDSQRMRDVTLFCGGNAVVMFNSTMQESVTNFCDRIGMESRTNKNGYNGVTKLMNDVLGIKYVLSAQGRGSTLYQFISKNTDGNLTVYENDSALPLGFMVNSDIRDWDIEAGTPIDVQNEFVTLATGLGPIYTLDRYLTLENGQENGIRIPDGKQVYVYLPQRVSEVKLSTPEFVKTYTTFTDHLYVINACDGEDTAAFTASMNAGAASAQAIVYTCPDALEEAVVSRLRESPLEDVKASGNRLTGKVSAKKAGVLMLTVPYDESWTCRVDGEKVTPVMIGACLMGLDLDEGDHEISLTYVPQGFGTGALLGAACIALYILSFLAYRRKHKADRKGFDVEQTAEDLADICGSDAVLVDEPMSRHTTFRIGGTADVMVSPEDEEGIIGALRYLRERKIPYTVIGNGSNLLVSDEGFRGVVVHVGRAMGKIRVDGNRITAQAGAMLSSAARQAADHSLSGMECVSGIPGTLGGALAMNAGAYGTEMKDIVRSVRVLTQKGEVIELTGEDCRFGYRTSRIQQENMIALEAVIELKPGDPDEIRGKMKELREKRAQKQPLEYPSAGSTFKRPEGHFAGQLIEEAGLRGYRVGGAAVSEKHCGFVVNLGGATAEDVRTVVEDVRKKVYETSGVRIEPEVRMIGFRTSSHGSS